MAPGAFGAGEEPGDVSRKYLLLPVVAGGLWLLTVNAGWALTAYVVAMGKDSDYVIDPSTIQDTASGHRTADVYGVGVAYLVDILKLDFDCTSNHAQFLSDKLYEAKKDGMDFITDKGGEAEPSAVNDGTTLQAAYTFVCGWPQVSSGPFKIDPEPPDLQSVVAIVSEVMMKDEDESESK